MNPYAGNPAVFPATVPLPDDSDPPMAATFNPAPQGLADRTAWLKSRVGGYRLIGVYQFGSALQSTTTVPWSATNPVTPANTYVSLTGATALLGGGVPVANATDIIEVEFSTSCAVGGTLGTLLTIGLSFSDNGGAYAIIPTTVRNINLSAPGPLGAPVVLRTTYGVGGDGHTFNFGIMGRADNATSIIDLFSSWEITVKLWRAN